MDRSFVDSTPTKQFIVGRYVDTEDRDTTTRRRIAAKLHRPGASCCQVKLYHFRGAVDAERLVSAVCKRSGWQIGAFAPARMLNRGVDTGAVRAAVTQRDHFAFVRIVRRSQNEQVIRGVLHRSVLINGIVRADRVDTASVDVVFHRAGNTVDFGTQRCGWQCNALPAVHVQVVEHRIAVECGPDIAFSSRNAGILIHECVRGRALLSTVSNVCPGDQRILRVCFAGTESAVFVLSNTLFTGAEIPLLLVAVGIEHAHITATGIGLIVENRLAVCARCHVIVALEAPRLGHTEAGVDARRVDVGTHLVKAHIRVKFDVMVGGRRNKGVGDEIPRVDAGDGSCSVDLDVINVNVEIVDLTGLA